MADPVVIMASEIVPPTRDELDQRIAQTERQLSLWHGNEGYARTLEVEIYALRTLRAAMGSVAT